MDTRDQQRRAPSLWALVAPALTSIAMTMQLFIDGTNKLLPAVVLGGSLGLAIVLLVQRQRAGRGVIDGR